MIYDKIKGNHSYQMKVKIISKLVSNGGCFVTKTREENLGFDQYHMLVEPPDHQI